MNVIARTVSALMIMSLPSLGLAMGQAPAVGSEGSLIGKVAYDVSLPTVTGGRKSISQACGSKKAVIFFWATWCPHCHDEITRMVQNLDAITKDLNVVLVSEGETKADVAAYLKNNKVPLDSLLDEDAVLQEPYQLEGVPTLFFVDEKGVIRDVRHDLPGDQ